MLIRRGVYLVGAASAGLESAGANLHSLNVSTPSLSSASEEPSSRISAPALILAMASFSAATNSQCTFHCFPLDVPPSRVTKGASAFSAFASSTTPVKVIRLPASDGLAAAPDIGFERTSHNEVAVASSATCGLISILGLLLAASSG